MILDNSLTDNVPRYTYRDALRPGYFGLFFTKTTSCGRIVTKKEEATRGGKQHLQVKVHQDTTGRSGLSARTNFFRPPCRPKSMVAFRAAPLPLMAITLPRPCLGCRTNMPW